jgi:hypothetical protein
MRARTLLIAGCTFTTMLVGGGAAQEVAGGRPPLAVTSVRVTIEGTSKSAHFFASTTTAHVTRLQLAQPLSPDVLQQALRPGQLEAFDITIPVTTLTSRTRPSTHAFASRSRLTPTRTSVSTCVRSRTGRTTRGDSSA